MKKVFSLLLALSFLLFPISQFNVADAASNVNPIIIAGEDLDHYTKITPIFENNRNYVPFKDVFSALYLNIKYDAKTKEVSAERDGLFSIKFIIGEKSVTVNGVEYSADASFVRNGVTYMPINYITQKGTGLSIVKKAGELYVEGKVYGRKNSYYNGQYYEGEGYIKGIEFYKDGFGKFYDKDGNVIIEPITRDGVTGYFKMDKWVGWFKSTFFEIPSDTLGSRIFYYNENGRKEGREEYYDKSGDLVYYKILDKYGDTLDYVNVKKTK